MVKQPGILSLVLAGLIVTGCQPTNDDGGAQAQSARQPTGDGSASRVVLVAGATGRTGRRIVTQLLERGYTVRAFVRDEQRARERLGERVEYAVGDVRDPASVVEGLSGVQAVISAIGSSGRAQDPSNTPEAVDYQGVRNLVDAAVQRSVSRFVLVSSMGVTVDDHPLNQMFDNVLKWKLKGEEHLRASGIPYTIVRPGGLTEEPGGEQGIQVVAEDVGEGFVPRADVATVCIEALEHPEAVNKTFSVFSGTNPRDADWAARFAAIPPG